MIQNLTFEAASAAFSRYKVAFSEDKYIALGLCHIQDDQFTNLAGLLSDQCQHSIKIAVFEDSAKTIFKDTREFGGSVLKQLEDAFSYLMLCNRTSAHIQGLERIERQDYPEEALREALLNAVIHRDYSFSGSIIININDSELEVISLGGLLPGLSPEDIRSGISQPRNRRLAELFHRLKLVESYGTGIRKIFSLYENSSIQPYIEVTTHTFKLVLPNQNTVNSLTKIEKVETAASITPQMKIILDYLEEYEELKEDELQDLLNIKRTRAYLLTRQMSEAGILEIHGRGSAKRYRLPEKQ